MIHKQVDTVLENWKEQSIKDGYSKFCWDGLMYKGEIKTGKSTDGNIFYYRSSGNEEEMWINAPIKVLFLNKDVPFNPDQDIREWIFRQHPTDITTFHYKNVALWLYGLLNIDNNGYAPRFEEVNDTLLYSSFLDKTPFAYVNCKKESGGNTIENHILEEYIDKYKVFLIKQILILEPDIIVCGGGGSIIKNFVIKNVYNKAIAINNWMFYDEVANKLIVDSYHPSYYGKTQEYVYSTMMDNYEEYLRIYPKNVMTYRN